MVLLALIDVVPRNQGEATQLTLLNGIVTVTLKGTSVALPGICVTVTVWPEMFALVR
jgi:hypothetical protein